MKYLTIFLIIPLKQLIINYNERDGVTKNILEKIKIIFMNFDLLIIFFSSYATMLNNK